MVGEQCHAVQIRLTGPEADTEGLTARLAAVGPWRLWVEDVPADSDAPGAARRRTAELNRPTETVRCVLLRHRDGNADLVVVAHRSALDRAGLARLTAVVSGASPLPGALPPDPRASNAGGAGMASGGASNAGGAGFASGGASVAGGAEVASGGASNAGGAGFASGGASVAGGAEVASGGASNAGGAGIASGGASVVGGAEVASGGASNAGGAGFASGRAEAVPSDWGGGVRGDGGWATGSLDLPAADAADTDGWLAALALTLQRYAGHGAPDSAVVATDLRGALELALPAGASLADLRTAASAATAVDRPVTAGLIEAAAADLPDAARTADGAAAAGQAVTDPAVTDPAVTGQAVTGQAVTDPAVTGQAVTGAAATGSVGAGGIGLGADRYLPCLAPPFPLTLALLPLPSGGARLWYSARSSHFSAETAAAFVRHLAHLYGQFAAAPHTPVADAELLDAAERERVARLGRPAQPLTGEPARLTDAFARIVAATPDATAVGDGDTSLTYRELDARADRLAHGLLAHGVTPGDRVGICLERTTELVVAMIGVLKAGAAYVPTDPAYPADRLVHTARDAGLALVITRAHEYPAEAGTAVTPDALTATDPTGPLPRTGGPDDPAYVIYTSGSTGRPKGVVVPHRNVVALIDATREEYGLGPDDTWTFFHSGAFDFSVWEIWGCLLTGGRLVVVPYLVSRDPEEFRDLLLRDRVTVLSQTPSAFSQLLETDHAPLPVRLVVFGGEPLDARMLLRWFDHHPESDCRMVNMFGITETTVHVTAQTVTRALALAGSRSVGPALPGWHLYVIDARGHLVPPGVTGEICVGGAGVALGYLGQPELTATRFTQDPYADGRRYHSGDLGRLRPDGTLEHLGRIDSQVKIRGFRIELDEIRSVLLEDPDVRAAAVIVRREDPADPASARLDAYVVPADLDTAGVRKRAAGVLPGYMLPATVTALDTLPLTTNGKLDAARLPLPVRTAAPAPAPAATEDGEDRAAVLQEIWTTVLGTPVGLDDDFFELGGNSLFAVRISAALRARGLPAVPLRDLFRTPTIRALAGTGDHG
ncbi:amino acid adenylation domain-containing protein [Streptomyces sp. NPDC048337]|uniref:non-ribosomal peptide synthetase n=1 Tax=Streptomyces sp. NPDC048337 TaxID=3365535 RepID=UPI0037217ADE